MFGAPSQEKAVLQTLKGFAGDRRKIVFEVERSRVHFGALLSVKKYVVALSKPANLAGAVKEKSVLRLAVPDVADQGLRLEVVKPHYNLMSGNAVILCRIPSKFVQGPQRQELRYDTRKFNNLHLELPSKEEAFRVMDLSLHGVNILVPYYNVGGLLSLGQTLTPARLRVGKQTAELGHAVPRFVRGQRVGMELSYGAQNDAGPFIAKLIEYLENPRRKPKWD